MIAALGRCSIGATALILAVVISRNFIAALVVGVAGAALLGVGVALFVTAMHDH